MSIAIVVSIASRAHEPCRFHCHLLPVSYAIAFDMSVKIHFLAASVKHVSNIGL